MLAVVLVSLLAPAMLLTLLRLTDPTPARLVQAVTFTPFATFLYAAALALLVAMMFVRRTYAATYSVTAGMALADWRCTPRGSLLSSSATFRGPQPMPSPWS